MKHQLGIGLINFNREDLLSDLLSSIKRTSTLQYDIVVADDGSQDNSVDLCHKAGIKCITGDNRGIAWNKNRALYYLINYTKAQNILLIENDCIIFDKNWMKVWVSAIEKWGHINCIHPRTLLKIRSSHPTPEIYSGTGTVDAPYLCSIISGICIGSTRKLINKVGYLDTRFKGYGHEHSEWTLRFRRLGFGYKYIKSENKKYNVMISGGVTAHLDILSSSDKSLVHKNRKVMDECKKDSIYRMPWRNQQEKEILLKEISQAH